MVSRWRVRGCDLVETGPYSRANPSWRIDPFPFDRLQIPLEMGGGFVRAGRRARRRRARANTFSIGTEHRRKKGDASSIPFKSHVADDT